MSLTNPTVRCTPHLVIFTLRLLMCTTGWRRYTGCPVLTRLFSSKSPIMGGSFAKRDLQLKLPYSEMHSTSCHIHSPSSDVHYRVAKMHGMPYLCTSLFVKEPYNEWLFCHSLANISVAVCCSVLQCVAVCCSVLQCVAVCCSTQGSFTQLGASHHIYCSVLQCVAGCCSALQCVTAHTAVSHNLELHTRDRISRFFLLCLES